MHEKHLTHKDIRTKRTQTTNRKEQRKVLRVLKKNAGHETKRRPAERVNNDTVTTGIKRAPPAPRASKKEEFPSKTILKQRESNEGIYIGKGSSMHDPPSPPPLKKLSHRVKDQLAADDAEIAALEKALKIKTSKNLPKSFEDDGLIPLLDGLEDSEELGAVDLGKRKRNESHEWLQDKRRRAQTQNLGVHENGLSILSLSQDDIGEGTASEFDEGASHEEDSDVEESDVSTESSEILLDRAPPTSNVRENPYIAPQLAGAIAATPKYRPPSMRDQQLPDSEDFSRLKRRIQGHLNRLSEANLISILGEIESLYRTNARQHISAMLVDNLMGIFSSPVNLQDTFIILHAGFIAAVYKIIGAEFGAQVVQKIDGNFVYFSKASATEKITNKALSSLIRLLSELYNFQVVENGLIFDFVRMFIQDFSETNVELLLQVIRSKVSGPQLRHDNPSALKDIVLLLQQEVERIGEGKLSVRTKFMIETMNNLKNNRMKTGVAASLVTSEHTVRMKKLLGSLNVRNIKASEPLRLGLKDIRESDGRGKWWLVGASYKDSLRENVISTNQTESMLAEANSASVEQDITSNLAHLARDHRMNTDVRRSIFIAIMSAADFNDAYLRLKKLRLKKSQELEIPKVIIHCTGAENSYNPYYTLLSRRVCSDRRLKMAFQFSLWDLFKQMGEGDEHHDEEQAQDGESGLELRSIVNLSKMFGSLVVYGCLSLVILKNLNFLYLPPKTSTFVELLLIAIILQSQKGSNAVRDERRLLNIFLLPKEMVGMAKTLRLFIKKVVSRTDVAGSATDTETIRWGCKLVRDALQTVG
ncbi:MAG: hypothetical protein Q9167_002371 [Letrouitia subvulpina]